MKNWKKISIGALCVMSLLAGCGTQGGDTSKDNNADNGTDAPKEITLEQVRADNTPEKLLEKHSVVTVSVQGTDQDDQETYTAKVQYTRDSEKRLLMASHYSYTANSPVGEDEFYAQSCFSEEGYGVYLNTMQSDDRLGMNCYPAAEYETYILDMLPACREADDSANETVDEQSEQDGAVLISTTTTYTDMTDYSKDESGESSVLGTTLYDWSYDETYAPEKELAAEALDSNDACELTLVFAPGTAEEETQNYAVKRGTYVTFASSTGNQLYADAELTQPLDDTQPIDTSGESMTVYVVPDAAQG